MNMAVKDVMTTQVTWVEQDTPFAAIAAALRRYRVSAFPVLDEESHVIGVVSESDLLNKMALGGGEDHMPGMITGILRHKQLEKARGVTAGDLMTAPPVTASPEDTVEHAARLMYLRGVKRLPVVDPAVAWQGSSAGPTCWPSTAARTPRSPRTSGSACCRQRARRIPARSTSR